MGEWIRSVFAGRLIIIVLKYFFCTADLFDFVFKKINRTGHRNCSVLKCQEQQQASSY